MIERENDRGKKRSSPTHSHSWCCFRKMFQKYQDCLMHFETVPEFIQFIQEKMSWVFFFFFFKGMDEWLVSAHGTEIDSACA